MFNWLPDLLLTFFLVRRSNRRSSVSKALLKFGDKMSTPKVGKSRVPTEVLYEEESDVGIEKTPATKSKRSSFLARVRNSLSRKSRKSVLAEQEDGDAEQEDGDAEQEDGDADPVLNS